MRSLRINEHFLGQMSNLIELVYDNSTLGSNSILVILWSSDLYVNLYLVATLPVLTLF